MNKKEIAKRMKQDADVTSGNTYTNKMAAKKMGKKETLESYTAKKYYEKHKTPQSEEIAKIAKFIKTKK